MQVSKGGAIEESKGKVALVCFHSLYIQNKNKHKHRGVRSSFEEGNKMVMQIIS